MYLSGLLVVACSFQKQTKTQKFMLDKNEDADTSTNAFSGYAVRDIE